MARKYAIPVRQMIYEAVTALGGQTTNVAVRDWIIERFPGTNQNTIQAQIIVCTVNHNSRVHYPENNRPRQAADERYDFLYRPAFGRLEWYNPQLHGVWYIIQDAQGGAAISQQPGQAPQHVPVAPSPPRVRPAATPVPVTHAQINAASYLFRLLPQWEDTERIFMMLRDRLPGFSYEEVVVKAATLNHLYSTRVFALMTISKHIAAVMADPPGDPDELVTALATVPDRASTKGPRHHWSFAAKFTHFFVDADRFPIYDSYNVMMLRYHLGRQAVVNNVNPYAAFKTNLQRFQTLEHLEEFSFRELDRYLWLAGLYRDWLKGNREINVEAQELFTAPGVEARGLLDILIPSDNHPIAKAVEDSHAL